MDPLSVTLAVISLSTAIKDMVELGQKIHKSFAKVSDNLRNAQRVAEDINEMVEEIKLFCEDHRDTLDDMKGFCLAVQSLLGKFREFETSILPLLPQTGERRQGRLARGWDTWRNSSKIDGSILDLQSDIMKLIRRFMMKSVMRTEVKLETIHQDTTRGLNVLEAVQRDVSALRVTAATTMLHRSYDQLWTASNELNRNIITFAQSSPSTSTPMLRTPNEVITEEVMTTAYIKLQFNSIATIVEKMSMLPASAITVVAFNSVTSIQMYPTLEEASMSVMHLRHHIVRQVTHIRNLLEGDPIHTISLQDGTSALNMLSIGLDILGMAPESILVGTWAITLARLLVAASESSGGKPVLCAKLALYLLNQSMQFYYSDDNIQSLKAIEEAYTITQNLQNPYSGEVHLRVLCSSILLQYARLVSDERSIEMSVEAIQVLEDILNIQTFTQSRPYRKIDRVLQPGASFLDHLFSSAPPMLAIQTYAIALQRLGTYLFIDGHPENALDLLLLAIAVRRKMVAIYGHEFNVHLAIALSLLVQGAISDLIPVEELVSIAEECIQLFRELAKQNPRFYAPRLFNTLLKKASTLQRLDRDAEALAAWEEAASLIGQINLDSELCVTVLSDLSGQLRRLKRYDDAARTETLVITTYHEKSETRAWRYFYLSKDLQQLRRYEEAAEAARTSVTLYRQLAMRDPKAWMGDLAEGLSDLAHCLAALGNYAEASISWNESVSMLDNFLNTHTNTSSNDIGGYREALVLHQKMSLILGGEEECLTVSSISVQQLCRLSTHFPQSAGVLWDFLWGQYCYAYTMCRLGWLQETLHYIERWFDAWYTDSVAISDSGIVPWYVTMMNLKANVLDAQGCTEQALLVIQKVPEIVGQSTITYLPFFFEMIRSMVYKARLEVNLGNSKMALQVVETALQLARDSNNLRPTTLKSLVWSLYAVALTALSCRNYGRAFEAAQQGYNISTSSDWQDNESEDDVFIRPSLLAFLSFAEANLGRYSTAAEYAHRAVYMALEIGENKMYIPTTTAEQCYMETRGYLSDILLASGDLVLARQICEERRAHFSKRVETRMGDYRELAPTLRLLGILCCSEGRHEEGNTAAQELSHIFRTLGSAFPSLRDQVKIRLCHQAKVPILKVLNDMCQNLDCGHQVEVVSLFSS